MKCSVYYPDRPDSQITLNADSLRAAAGQFFAQHARPDDCLIRVVPSGVLGGDAADFRTTEFMDKDMRRSALATPPSSRPATEKGPQARTERGSAEACIGIGIILSLIGGWFLLQPSADMGRSFESGFPALVNIHKLYIGQTCTIAGAIFLAVGIRPRP